MSTNAQVLPRHSPNELFPIPDERTSMFFKPDVTRVHTEDRQLAPEPTVTDEAVVQLQAAFLQPR